MKPSSNRLEADLDQWQAREQRFSKMFYPAVLNSKAFQQEKLVYYEELRAKYRNPVTADERIALKVLTNEKNRIEKKLYPNFLVRLVRRAFLAFIRPSVERRENLMLENNHRQLRQQMNDLGFARQGKRLEQMMAQGKESFSMPVSWYNDEKQRMDFDVAIKRQDNGTYKLDSYKATSINTDVPGEKKEHRFSFENDSLNARQAGNLLAGRSLQIDGIWKQLDFNDKDAAGNFRMKEFHQGYGYDILKTVQQLPIKELKNPETRENLLAKLSNGDQVEVTINVNGTNRKLSIEANPQFKTINILNDSGDKMSIAAALGKERKLGQPQVKELKQDTKMTKRNSVSVG